LQTYAQDFCAYLQELSEGNLTDVIQPDVVYQILNPSSRVSRRKQHSTIFRKPQGF